MIAGTVVPGVMVTVAAVVWAELEGEGEVGGATPARLLRGSVRERRVLPPFWGSSVSFSLS